MKIKHFEVDSQEDQTKLSALPADFSRENLTSANAGQSTDVEIATVFVNSVVDTQTIDAMPNLKLLITRSTGFDHIDVPYAHSKEITVCNIPGYGSRTVAEFTFALILGLSRKIFGAVEQIKHNNWETSHFEGFNLQGKTIGIVGTGRIGLNVAQIARGFDMKIIAHDAFPNEQKAESYGFKYASSLEELLGLSDVVTLHVPATKDTKHLINLENISKFKKGALLINTARGDVIDPQAILLGLQENILSGVGLDVIDGEHELKEEAELMREGHISQEKLKTLLSDHALMNHPKVLITPHIAFNTQEARLEIITATLNNIRGFLEDEPQNIVTS